jgi:hypothetical protein
MLLRVVVVVDSAGTGVVPDPCRRQPGRGAHLHLDPECLAKAERRRAFGRALRVAGVVDTSVLTAYVAVHADVAAGPVERTGLRVARGTTDGGVTHPDQQGRTTDMSTR